MFMLGSEGEFLSMETADSGGYPREQRSIQAGGNRQSANAHASAAVSVICDLWLPN